MLVHEERVDDLDQRLGGARVDRSTAYVVAIPGYRPVGRDYGGGLGDDVFELADEAAVPADRYVSVVSYPDVSPAESMCGQRTAIDSRLTWGRCETEPNGLVYRDNGIHHGYQVAVGERHVSIAGSPSVPRDLLRAGATSIRPATTAELSGDPPTGEVYAVTIPGYLGKPTGIPRGMLYEPVDGAGGGAQSVSVQLDVAFGDLETFCRDARECATEGTGPTYARQEHTHGYAMRREDVTVIVVGGLRVDRALLRQAALDARPATYDELFLNLSPAPTKTRLDRILDWLRSRGKQSRG
jgi:hypothetical protein